MYAMSESGWDVRFSMTQNITRRLGVWAMVIVVVLTVPLVAMQFTDEVAWGVMDFAIIGTLLFGVALAYEVMANKFRTRKERAVIGIVLAVILLYIWAELSVGIFTHLGS